MQKKVLTFMLAFVLSLSFVTTASAMGYHESDIEKYIMGQLSNAKIPGGSVSIVTSGKEVYSASFGDVPETTSDLKIGSVSKVFTSLAVLQLADSKKLKLDTSVSELVTGFDGNSDVTVEELLRQTSGYTAEQSIKGDRIPAPDGKKGEYKDARINYAILGKIVEAVSESDYSEYIQKKIVKPLKLESTYTTDEMSGKDIVGGHDNIFGLPVAKRAVSNDDKEWDAVSATGIVSNAKDMGNVLSMYLAAGGQTLSYNQIEKIYSDGVDCGKTIFGTNGTSSLGWIKTKVGKQDVYYVSGAIDGYISAAFLVPGQDVGIAMLFDTSDVISGNDVISELMSNVVCLAIGEKARTIDSKAVMMPHIEFDVVYVIAFFASLLPMFMMSWWYRRTRNKGIGIVKTIVDVVVHIALPIVIYQFVPVIIENVLGNSLGSWFMIKKFLPECYYITLIVDVILLIGVPVKVIAAIIAMKKGPVDEDEEMAEDELFENLGDDAEKSDEDKEEETEQITSDDVKQQESDETSEKSEKNEDENLDGSNDIADKDGKTITDISETEQGVSDDDNAEISDSKQDMSELENVTEEIAAAAEEDDDIENVETKNDISETESQDEQADALKTQDEVVKEFKTRSGKNKKTEEYESSFEREAVKALETDEHENSDDTNDELKDIKSDSQMQTAVPKIKKRYNPQKGMPVKIVVEPDDDLDN
jgi:CubicO group peptidase (beta-lactamase class C family)